MAVAVAEKKKQTGIAGENADKRAADVEHCKNALEREVIPFLSELKHHLGDDQFSFAAQIRLNDHRPMVFTIGNGANQHYDCIREHHRNPYRRWRNRSRLCLRTDVEDLISNSGTSRDKIAKLVEMVIADPTAGE
jgi:hypothetical protein